MAVVFALALLVAGALLLLKGADWFVDGAGDIARALGISALLIGAVLAGLEPDEMLTAAIASARGAPDLALGNAIGTNITILTAALGFSATLVPIRLTGVARQAIIATLASVPPIILLFTGLITRLEGALLIVLFAAYTLVLIRADRSVLDRREELEELEEQSQPQQVGGPKRPERKSVYVRRKALVTLGGLVAMALGGPAIVEGALRLASAAGLRQSAVGLTIVSLGTSAEMIALGIIAARKGRSDLLVGGIIGSFAYNLLVTLGLAAVINPLPVNAATLQLPIIYMAAVHLALLLVIFTLRRIPRVVGIGLLLLYLVYLALILAPNGHALR